MADNDNPYLGDPIPLEDDPKPIPLNSGGKAASGSLPPLSTGDSEDSGVFASSKIHTFQSDSKLGRETTEYHRALNSSEHGATRVRTFHAKLTDGAMSFLDRQINEWLDVNDDIVVKFTSNTIGQVEGKHRTEPHMIISVWY